MDNSEQQPLVKQQPQILSPEGGRCTQVWLYFKIVFFSFLRENEKKHF